MSGTPSTATEKTPAGAPVSDAAPRRLIVFTRYPEPGKTKTRLVPALGPQGAADLQREMARHTLRWAKTLASAGAASVEVHFEGGSEDRMRQCFGNDLPYRAQPAGDLGTRLAEAFRGAFQSGARWTVIVGADCPELSPSLVEDALDRLAEHDLVLGPAADGGYYLVGLRREVARLFHDVPWGTSGVLEATLGKAAELNLSVALLETLADVDRPEDLDAWYRVVADSRHGRQSGRISVIVPTLNEDDGLLEAVLRSAGRGRDVETIVVDARPRGSTRRIAAACGARALSAPRGRARQMNAGAAAAGGEMLLFLHADTRLPADFDRHVRDVLSRPGVAAGAFRLAIEGASGTLRWIARAANLRARLLRMPYGDQAIFLTAEKFHAVGGFPDVPILEDVDLVHRLRQTGRVALAPAEVVTSARRWLALGAWRTTRINQRIMAGYCLGVSRERLARWYRGGRNGS